MYEYKYHIKTTSFEMMTEPNFAHQTIWTEDCFKVMRVMNSQCKAKLRGKSQARQKRSPILD